MKKEYIPFVDDLIELEMVTTLHSLASRTMNVDV